MLSSSPLHVLLVVCISRVSEIQAANWAILVTGSHTYDNYRHHADVAHAYQRLRAGGIPDSNIISMQYNDVANDPQNPYPNSLYNKPSGKLPGKDVNKGFVKDFTGANVTRNNFLGALLCNRTMMDGGGALGGALHAGATTGVSTKCLQSTAEDDVFLYWAGHGSTGFLLFPDMNTATALYADDLIAALTTLHAKGRFKRFVLYVEACESGSMFANTLSAAALPGVYAVTAASPSQPSYPIYCCVFERPPSCTVHGQDIGSCLGDQFSVGWLEAADLNSKAETLEQSFLKGKKRARAIGGNPGSTVEQYGDKSYVDTLLSDFIGSATRLAPAVFAADAAAKEGTEDPPEQEEEERRRMQTSAAANATSSPAAAAAAADDGVVLTMRLDSIAARLRIQEGGARLAPLVPGLEDFACYKRVNAALDAACVVERQASSHSPNRRRYQVALHVCKQGLEQEAYAAMTAVCI